MSTGPSHLHAHQVQHGHPASQPFHHSRAVGLHDGTVSVMDASNFADFSFGFPPLSEQGHDMTMPADQSPPPLAFDERAATHFPHPQQPQPLPQPHHPVATVAAPPLSSTSHSMTSIATTAFRADSENRRSSPGTSDESTHDRNSPALHAFEDPPANEFGLPGSARADSSDFGGKVKDDKAGAPPAWSELKTKAGKDRKRLPLACIACRRKKIRCSGEKPACKHCLRSRIPCVYKVTTRKAAPRTDYMAMLDKRLKRMEERIIKIIPKADHDATPSVTRAVVKPAIPPSGLPHRPPWSKKRALDEAFASELDAWAKVPPKSKAADVAPQEEEETLLFREGIDALPAKEVQEHLAEVFFDHVYGQAYHLLHKPSYMRKLKNNALPPVLILSVCAVAARFTPNPKISPAPRQFLRGEEWASHARDICTRRYAWPNITILTCLLILGLHEFGTCHGGRSWALGGQAIRMAFALQLHKDLEYDPLCRNAKTPLSFINREIRRRIMWACFLMDRFNSSGSDRPMFIKEECLKIQLPVSERYFQLDMPVQTQSLDGTVPDLAESDVIQARDNMGVAAFIIRSIAIWGRIVTYLNQGGKEMDIHPMWSPESEYAKLVDDIDGFVRSLPPVLQYSQDNLDLQMTEKTASQFILLHLSVQQNLLFLGQAGLTFANSRPGTETTAKDFFSRTSGRTFSAANRISDILRDAEQSQCCVSASFAGYCAFSSTTIHIMSIVSGNPTAKMAAEANSSVNIQFLRKMMRYWGMFHWMVENIRTQYRNTMNAAQLGKSGNGAPLTSPIIQYGDWYNRYPHGVSDSDLLDPTIIRKKEKGEDAVLEQKPELQSVQEFVATLSPAQSAEAKDAQGRRKQLTIKRQSEAEQPEASPPPHPAGGGLGGVNQSRESSMLQQPLQSQPQPQPPPAPRPFSNSLGGQASGPSGFSPVDIPQTQFPQPFASLSPASPASMNPFTPQRQQQPPPSTHHSFLADMLTMNMPRSQQLAESNDLIHPLERPISFGTFSMESSGCGAIANGRLQEQNPLAAYGPDAAVWLLPIDMDAADEDQTMSIGGNAVDAINMFGVSGNHFDTLRHVL